MTLRTRPHRLVTAAVVLATCVGCRDAPQTSSVVVRDSSSVHIVEATPGLHAPNPLEVSAAPFSAQLPEFGDILDVALAPGGRVLVLDPLGPDVVVLDSTGVERVRFGGDGDGPGEFRAAGLTELVVLGDTVAVPDIMGQRVTLFDLGGRVLDVLPVDVSDGLTVDWRRGGRDRMILRRVSSPQRLEVLSLADRGIESLVDLSSLSLPSEAGPLMPLPVWCRLDEGRLVVGRTDAYSLRVTDGDATTAILRGHAEERSLSEADVAHLGELLQVSLSHRFGRDVDPERVRQLLERTPLPKQAPRIAGLRCVGNSEVWVQRALPVAEMDVDILRVGSTAGWGSSVWDVFDVQAGTLRRVDLPAGTHVTRVTQDMVVGYTQDEYGRKTPARWVRQ